MIYTIKIASFDVINVYSKQPIFGLTQESLRELSFSRLECGVHDKLGVIQVLRNADGGGGCQIFRKKALRRCKV